jgi:predicted DNA-binding protein with PD1-like motif
MNLIPLRLQPSQDLKASLEAWIARQPGGSGWIVSGIGSLSRLQLRLAGRTEPSVFHQDLEILSLQGSLSRDGSHIHVTVADQNGLVLGGHLSNGSVVRTTAELLVTPLPRWQLRRTPDAGTGYSELMIQPRFRRFPLLRWREWCSRKGDS